MPLPLRLLPAARRVTALRPSPPSIPTPLRALAGGRAALLLCSLAVRLAGANPEPDGAILSLTELKRLSVEDLLAQPVVSVSRKPEAWSQAASDIILIRDVSTWVTGASTLPQLLRLAPTLFVAQKSATQWAVNARGFVRTNAASNKLLVMIDGRTAYSPLFSNVFWESTAMFLPDLERIEVIGGPAGSTWGANAVNGVINLESKSAQDTLGGLVFATAGTQSTGFGARYGARLPANGAIRFYAQGTRFEATRTAAGDDDEQDPARSLQTGFRADWGDEYEGALTVQGDWFAGRYQLNPSQDGDTNNGNLLVRWSRELSPRSHLWVRAYHDHAERLQENDFREITRTTDFEFQHRWDFGSHQELLWGANYRAISDSIGDTVGFAILPAKLDFGLGSLFGQHQLRFADEALQLTTGLRLEHNHFSAWETQPSLRLAWNLPAQTFWLAASRATRIPSRLDTGFFAPVQPPYLVAGGPQFTSETVRAYETGWRLQPRRNLSLTTTGYYHDYARLRSVEPTPATVFPLHVANGLNGRSYGVELFADWDVTPWWRIRAGGFLMHQATAPVAGAVDLEGGLGEASFPKHQFHVRNTFRFNSRASLWTSLRRIGAVPASEGGGGRVPAYTELDATLTWTLSAAMELSVSGFSLLHRSHPEIGGLVDRREIPRSFQSTVRWHF